VTSEYLQDLFGLDGQRRGDWRGWGARRGALSRAGWCRGARRRGRRRRGRLQGPRGRSRFARPPGELGLVDVTRRASIESLLAEAKKPTGQCDILVNCAGVNNGTPFLDHTEEAWTRPFDQSQGHVPRLSGVRPAHGRAGQRRDRQHRQVTSHLPLSTVFGYSARKPAC